MFDTIEEEFWDSEEERLFIYWFASVSDDDLQGVLIWIMGRCNDV